MSGAMKGIVSAVYKADNTATVILPECGGVVTKPLPIHTKNSGADIKVNDFVIVLCFSDDYNDSVILEKQSRSGGSSPSGSGNMEKSTYDTNENGIVDDAEKLGGQPPSYYAAKTDIPTKVADLSDAEDYAVKDHSHAKDEVGLGNVPNVTTNNQTPTFTAASTLSALVSGERLSVVLGKIAKAVSDLISHISNKANPHNVTAEQIGAAESDHTHSGYAASSHTHDDRYFTETEVTNKLAGKSDTGHTHDDRYYTESEIDTKLSGKADSGHAHANYVDLTSAQNIKAAKTFDGEQKFSNASYCPTISDTASGIGCSFKASRGLFNEALIDKIIMTATTGKIPFYKYTGTSGGSMTGLTEIASINADGTMLLNGKDVWSANNKPMGTYTGNGSATARTIAVGGKGSVLLIYYASFVVFVGSGGGCAINFYDGSLAKVGSGEVKLSGGTLTIASTSQFLNQSSRGYGYILL